LFGTFARLIPFWNFFGITPMIAKELELHILDSCATLITVFDLGYQVIVFVVVVVVLL
jgi:hypothetical protein